MNIQSTDNDKTLSGLSANTEYKWQVKNICATQPSVSSDWSAVQTFTTAALKSGGTSNETVFEVYPNPFTSAAVISFSIHQNSKVHIELYDIAGRKLQHVLDENLGAGNHEVNLNRDQLNSGIYFVRLLINDEVTMKKIVIE